MSTHGEQEAKVYELRPELVADQVAQLFQSFAEEHEGSEVTLAFRGDNFPMTPLAAVTLGLLMARSAAVAKTENLFKLFMEDYFKATEAEALAVLMDFREFSAKMAEDQFRRFE